LLQANKYKTKINTKLTTGKLSSPSSAVSSHTVHLFSTAERMNDTTAKYLNLNIMTQNLKIYFQHVNSEFFGILCMLLASFHPKHWLLNV